MCWDCFKNHTDKPVVNAWVQRAYDLITSMDDYQTDFLHIIIGDMNVGDYHFNLNREQLNMAYEEASLEERVVFDALAKLTEPERATAVAMVLGYIERDGTLRSDLR